MPSILAKIVENKRSEVASAAVSHPIETLREICEPSTRDFAGILVNGRKKNSPNLIAEVKRRSPSEGKILQNLDLEKMVTTYCNHASAISILTDQKYFGGSLEDLDAADHVTRVPLLRKDFILDEYQLFESRQFGADAVLLIAAILDQAQIENLITVGRSLGLDALVEVHDEAELEKVLATSASIIGINNRNLDTLEIDLATTTKLAPCIPQDKIIVAESGIRSRADIAKLKGSVDAVLVGTSILKADDMESKLEELSSKD